MLMNLQGKTAIITGGTRDIGNAISLKLAKEGVKVVVNYLHSQANTEQTLKEIISSGGEGIIVKGDMTKKADVDNLVKEAISNYGSIYILVNNAGGLVARKTLEEMDEAFFDKVIKLNLYSVFMVTKSALSHMKSGASIINIASQAGRDGGGTGSLAYATSKGAVMTFSRGLAKEVGPRNIRVKGLCPGMIATTFHDTFTNDEIRKKIADSTPLRRQGTAEEIANTVACLASNQTSFITGANIDINGGLAFS
ncbi:LOW QUALITY PROTEIN: 3-oxoacyl-[acyl-carrier protein] reductase [Gillisia sp. Hel_I_86]|nr:LOW QUALITY PROTEIN: 3-oxoacyl-[acyl-carrier protein] reductase [Gillisia sp. Hel_I_86]